MKYLPYTILALPFLVFAQTPTDFRSLVGLFLELINLLIPVIFALTFIVLVWGVTKAWILNAGDTNEIEQGKRLVLIGIVALVIMASIWGILELLRSSIFGVY